MNEITLNWQEINYYKNLSKKSNQPGIYIWGFYGEDDFIPYYVGKALSVWWRLGQHLYTLNGGGANIYQPKHFVNFKEHKKNDYLYCPDSPSNIIKFMDNSNKLLKSSLKFMVDNFHFTYALARKEHLEDLEKSVINSIGKENLINNRSGINKKFFHRNGGDKRVCDILSQY